MTKVRKLHPSFKLKRSIHFIKSYYGGRHSEKTLMNYWCDEYAQGKLFADQDPSLEESPFTPVPKITTPPPKVVKERHELPNGFALCTVWSQENSTVWFKLIACQGFPGFPLGTDLSLKSWFDGAANGDEAREVIRTTVEKLRGMLGG